MQVPVLVGPVYPEGQLGVDVPVTCTCMATVPEVPPATPGTTKVTVLPVTEQGGDELGDGPARTEQERKVCPAASVSLIETVEGMDPRFA